MQPIIFHLDMNSYFASVEQQDNPQYRGRPLGVCEHLGGIIIAASIEAKRWGIKTGTPVWEAKKLYPKIILVHTNPERYRYYNRLMVKVVGDYSNFVEKYSIDEVFIDMTKVCNSSSAYRYHFERVQPREESLNSGLPDDFVIKGSLTPFGMVSECNINPFQEAINIAGEIKARMKKEVGDWLSCSIGIAENKLLAKIASDMQKPDGMVVIGFRAKGLEISQQNKKPLILEKEELYNKLKLTDIPGIARRQEKRLGELGINSLKDLRDYPRSKLVARFGILGHHLHAMGQLESTWKPQVEQDDKIKSIGHMYTLPMEYRKPEFFMPVLYKLCEMVGRRLRRQGLMGNVVSFYVRDKNYQSFGKDEKLGFYLYDGREIFSQCVKIFKVVMASAPPREFKLIGVTVGGLIPLAHQLGLFEREDKKSRVSFALDQINNKYGDFTVCRAPVLAAGKVFRDSIGFGRLREKYADKGT